MNEELDPQDATRLTKGCYSDRKGLTVTPLKFDSPHVVTIISQKFDENQLTIE